jgi:diguanylate cyclase (GGDEF)-like protein
MGLGVIHAVGERQQIRERQNHEIGELKSAAVTDHLTGLANRRGSDAALQKEFDRSIRTGKPLSLIYGDLDGFKKVNDQLSHAAGDQVLVKVGHLLKEQLRSYDHAARSGGDEFTLVLPETDQATAQALAARLQQAIKLDIGVPGNRHAVGISLGVVTRRQDEHSLQEFQHRADQEMYRIKRVRKNQFNL